MIVAVTAESCSTVWDCQSVIVFVGQATAPVSLLFHFYYRRMDHLERFLLSCGILKTGH